MRTQDEIQRLQANAKASISSVSQISSFTQQTHLNYKDKTNLGSFYTPSKLVALVYEMLETARQGMKIDTVLEPSCGYGAFLDTSFGAVDRAHSVSKTNNTLPADTVSSIRFIGADIDEDAIKIAKEHFPNHDIFLQNALYKVSRANYGISKDEVIAIVGNPPYNDKTSHIKSSVKNELKYPIDVDLQTRDIGISSLLAYNELKPEFIAVLHPLSYLIKRTNFNLLKPLFTNYQLKDALVFSSQEFSETSKLNGFPLVAAIYQRDRNGATYNDIQKRIWKTIEGDSFSLNQFEYISDYILKYPKKSNKGYFEGYYFYTMRDINALKRSRTFMLDDAPNAIHVEGEKLKYYHYVDIFKDYAKSGLPYYLGNLDIIIDNNAFLQVSDSFELLSKLKHPDIFGNIDASKQAISDARVNVARYFSCLFNVNFC
jgi:predicted RNA methylase